MPLAFPWESVMAGRKQRLETDTDRYIRTTERYIREIMKGRHELDDLIRYLLSSKFQSDEKEQRDFVHISTDLMPKLMSIKSKLNGSM